MVDLITEQRCGLHEAAKLYPSSRQGRPTHVSTVLRHITKGIRLPGGELVRLEGARLGGRWFTSVEAVRRFMERSTAAALPNVPSTMPSAINERRRRELDRVDAALDKAGI